MIETVDSEIDVERLMAEIRAAVAARDASDHRSLIGASFDLRKLLSTEAESSAPDIQFASPILQPREYVKPTSLKLQPEFVPSKDNHYNVNDLLQYHDHMFVWNAYRAILKREPDEVGLREFLGKLQSGRFNKIDILARLRFSPEGKRCKVRVDGLKGPAFVRQLYRLPVLGYLLELMVGIVRLPVLLRSQRQFEGHALAQQQLLADHLDLLSQTSFQVLESLSRELAELAAELSTEQNKLADSLSARVTTVSTEQRKFAELQYQQIVGLFRKHSEFVERVERIKNDVHVRINQLDASVKTIPGEQRSTVAGRISQDELFASFTDQFRGKRDEVKEGLKYYLPFLRSGNISSEVLDLGCGRGEWLELLTEEGLEARGVEINKVMAAEVRGKGLKVIEEDMLSYLRSLPDKTLNAVTGFHLIEHLSFENLVELLDETMRTLKSGGLVIFETPNPKNLVVGACNFYADPSHGKPLFPETLQFLLSNRGFTDVRLEYLNPLSGSPFLGGNEGFRLLDSWFFSPRDFAVIGRKN